jgi:hypothetical protein
MLLDIYIYILLLRESDESDARCKENEWTNADLSFDSLATRERIVLLCAWG